MLWQVDIYPAHGHLDRSAVEIINDATDLGFEQFRSCRRVEAIF